MNTAAPYPSLTSILLRAEAAFNNLGERLSGAVKEFDARWEARARRAVALRQLRALSDRDLHDIGIARGEIPRVAREANCVR